MDVPRFRCRLHDVVMGAYSVCFSALTLFITLWDCDVQTWSLTEDYTSYMWERVPVKSRSLGHMYADCVHIDMNHIHLITVVDNWLMSHVCPVTFKENVTGQQMYIIWCEGESQLSIAAVLMLSKNKRKPSLCVLSLQQAEMVLVWLLKSFVFYVSVLHFNNGPLTSCGEVVWLQSACYPGLKATSEVAFSVLGWKYPNTLVVFTS